MQGQLLNDAEWLSDVGCLETTLLEAFNLNRDAVISIQ